MSGIEAGIPLVQSFHGFILPSGMHPTPTHTAYPVEYARALEAFAGDVADAFRQIRVLAADGAVTLSEVRWICDRALEARAALDALAAARNEAP